MGQLDEHKETLRKEISSLIDSVSAGRGKILFENDPNSLARLLDDLAQLNRKTAALQALLTLPPEPAHVPVIPPPVEEKKPQSEMQPIVPIVEEKPAQPELKPVLPSVTITEEKKVVPEAKPLLQEKPAEIKKEEPVAEVKKETVAPVVQEIKASAGKTFPDLKSFIGFNEKLMFLRLFKNDSAAYEEAIAQLNNCQSKEEAMSFLSVLQSEYAWNSSSEPVQIFTDTVKRRFS